MTEESDGLWWTIPVEKLKMERVDGMVPLRVPLVGRAREIVERRIKRYGNGWLFPSAGELGHTQQKVFQTGAYYHQPYSETRPEAPRYRWSVSMWAPHDLRRTVRTQLAAMGCPGEVGEAILGHKLPGVEGVYNLHRYDAERRAWLTAWSDLLEAICAGQHSEAAAGRTPAAPRPTPEARA